MPFIYSFGTFRLDAQAELLLRGAEPVSVGRRAFSLLHTLIESHGKPVTKEALLRAAWPNLAVEESNLTVQIAALRRALSAEPGGELWLETIPRHGYRFIGPVTKESASDVAAKPALALPDKPSIAVLPFDNMTGNPQEDYFVDGVVEDIITALSRFPGLFVIARNSSFTYKGRAIDIKHVGRELGVRYVLEGSVRRSDRQLRITAQLIDASTAAHLWADRFDGEIKDIFSLQDEVTAAVVAAITPKVEQAEVERSRQKPTASLEAYDYLLRGRAHYHRRTMESNEKALECFSEAIQRDPDFATAYGMAALCYAQRKTGGWTSEPDRERAETVRLAERAVQVGREDAIALATAGFARARVADELEAGLALIERALALNPNWAPSQYYCGWIRIWLGEPARALDHLKQVSRLNPNDPDMAIKVAIAFAYFFSGKYDDACSAALQALLEHPSWHPALRISAASHALAGRLDEARNAMARLRQIDPELRIHKLNKQTSLRRAADSERYERGLRAAGLPD